MEDQPQHPYSPSAAPPPLPQPPPYLPMQVAQPGYGYLPPGYMPPVTADDRTMGMLCHLLSILTGFFGPLILWLVKKDQSPFINHHGREALNFQITVFLVSLMLVSLMFVLMFVFVGVLLIPVVIAVPILAMVAEIMACIAASRGEWHRYPCCLRLL